MWQNLINIILGLVLILMALVGGGMGAIVPEFGWTLGGVGFAVAAFAIWGIIDEIANQPRLDHGVEI